MRRLQHYVFTALLTVIAWQSMPLATDTADAEYGWDGRRRISYQYSKDLFYNQYVGPGPGAAAAEMYPAPMPVPENVGHTYYTYQPFYPNEYLYRHHRSYYNYHPGCGWTRTNARYHTDKCWYKGQIACQAAGIVDWSCLLDWCAP